MHMRMHIHTGIDVYTIIWTMWGKVANNIKDANVTKKIDEKNIQLDYKER